MYGCESWTIKKAQCQRIYAFKFCCWRRLLRTSWTARRSNQSILKISPGCSLEGLMLKLKLQYFCHLMQRADSLEKTLMLERLRAGGEGDDRGCDGWMASLTQWTWVWMESESWWWTGGLVCCGSWGCNESHTTMWLNWKGWQSRDFFFLSYRYNTEWKICWYLWHTVSQKLRHLDIIYRKKRNPVILKSEC